VAQGLLRGSPNCPSHWWPCVPLLRSSTWESLAPSMGGLWLHGEVGQTHGGRIFGNLDECLAGLLSCSWGGSVDAFQGSRTCLKRVVSGPQRAHHNSRGRTQPACCATAAPPKRLNQIPSRYSRPTRRKATEVRHLRSWQHLGVPSKGKWRSVGWKPVVISFSNHPVTTVASLSRLV
jgi:hypothetical protein